MVLDFRSYPDVLRAYSWLDAQVLLLERLKILYVVLGIKVRLTTYYLSPFYLYYLSWPCENSIKKHYTLPNFIWRKYSPGLLPFIAPKILLCPGLGFLKPWNFQVKKKGGEMTNKWSQWVFLSLSSGWKSRREEIRKGGENEVELLGCFLACDILRFNPRASFNPEYRVKSNPRVLLGVTQTNKKSEKFLEFHICGFLTLGCPTTLWMVGNSYLCHWAR